MIKQHFDLVTELHERIDEFKRIEGYDPKTVTLSPTAFEWLLAVFEEDRRVFGVSPVDYEKWTYSTDSATIKIVIDENIDNYDIFLS